MSQPLPPLVSFDTLWSLTESTRTPKCQAWIMAKHRILWTRRVDFSLSAAHAGFLMLVRSSAADSFHYALMLPSEDRIELLRSLSSERQGCLRKQILHVTGALGRLHPCMLQKPVADVLMRGGWIDRASDYLIIATAGLRPGSVPARLPGHVSWWTVIGSTRAGEYPAKSTASNLKIVYAPEENA